ncbi:MAG: glycosyltransferase family 2 protein [Bacteroidota bacterium]|jgi:polyisoprenyl-phosphate glycosyltransferase|nr:glycosyltransferase family 2 protein [Bacteroidota bacterium]
MTKRKATIIIPVFNEEGNIIAIVERLNKIFENLPGIEFIIIFVDDGSTDQSLPILMSLSEKNPTIFYLSLSKNFGKDNALMAGINFSDSDAVITIDADLQHPPELIPELINWWEQGYDVVYAYRKDRNIHASFFTRIRSQLFYYIINKLSDVKLENGISDFKLMDKRVIEVINKLPEDKPFLRGIIKWVGFKQMPIEYEPDERNSGSTKYDFNTLISLATHGLTSFSTKPLSFAIYLGFFFSALSLFYVPYVLLSFYFHWDRGPGWASVIVTIAFFGGLQLMIMGIIGLYLGKTFIQGKGRPRYIIQTSNLNFKNK